MRPDISIVMPLYNKRDYVAQAVASCLGQTCLPLELIVVDDGSTDGGAELVHAIGHSGVHVQQQQNAGVAAARNTGIELARGDFVCFVDADDVLLPHHLALISDLAQDFPQAAMLATKYKCLRRDGSTQVVEINKRLSKRGLIESFHREWSHGPFTFTSAIAARRRHLGRGQIEFPVGERWGEDQDVWFRLAEAGPVAYAPVESVLYRTEVSGSATVQEGARLQVLPAYDRLASRLADGLVPQHLQAGARRVLGNHLLNVVQSRMQHGDRAGALVLLSNPLARNPWHRYLRLRAMAGFRSTATPLASSRWEKGARQQRTDERAK